MQTDRHTEERRQTGRQTVMTKLCVFFIFKEEAALYNSRYLSLDQELWILI